jgi:putative phage-type endonuclease
MTAVELLPPAEAVHGNDRWYEIRRAGITASEIAIVLGISPYGSPFSLFWQKVNDWRDDGNVFTSTGRHLEDAIADWWAAEHAHLLGDPPLMRAGLYAHPDRPWQLATPDRKARFRVAGRIVRHALLECKWVAYSWDGWGEPGTDEIPVYYRAQALWQLDVLGVDEVHFAVLGPGGFRAYLVRRDEDDLAVMRAAGLAFHQRLESGDAPDLDFHSATLGALKRLHPSVGDGDVEVSISLRTDYELSRQDRKDAEERIALCEAQIRAALGSTYARAVYNGRTVASRSVFEQRRIDSTRLRKEQPEVADAYTTTSTVDRLNPGKAASDA